MTEPDDLQPVDDGEDDDTDFATIAGAATIQEAKRKALDQLRKVVPYVNEADVDFVVMEEGSKGGLFGRGKSEARVEARVRAGRRSASTTILRPTPRCCASSCRPRSISWASRRTSAPAKPARR